MLSNPNVLDSRLSPFRATQGLDFSFSSSASAGTTVALPILTTTEGVHALIWCLELSVNNTTRWLVRDHELFAQLVITVPRVQRMLTVRAPGLPAGQPPEYTPCLNVFQTFDPPLYVPPSTVVTLSATGNWSAEPTQTGISTVLAQLSGAYSRADLSTLGATPATLSTPLTL